MSDLETLVRELEAHGATAGWDQPERLYAVVRTSAVLAKQPDLRDALDAAAAWTPIEQEPLPPGVSLEDMLPEIIWPDEVDGCAAVLERVMLPPEVEAQVPADPEQAAEFAATHPDRREVRIVAAVLRDGEQACALRLRSHDDPADVIVGPDLVPGLSMMLHATLDPLPEPVEDDDPDE